MKFPTLSAFVLTMMASAYGQAPVCFSDTVSPIDACFAYCAQTPGQVSRVAGRTTCQCYADVACPHPECGTAEITDYAGLTFTGTERHFEYAIRIGTGGDYIQTDTNIQRDYGVGEFNSYDTTTTAYYTDGEYCSVIDGPRTGRVFMETNPSISAPNLISVSEPTTCYYEARFEVPCVTDPNCRGALQDQIDLYPCSATPEATGDPHFRTWKNEHFEFHGQCDILMTKVKDFVKEGIDLDIHLHTSMVRYWSYIKSAAIRIGDDILEVQGSAAQEDGEEKRHYHINYEYRGSLETVGGFPVTISPRNNKYTIDLDSKYPGQKIEISTFKEFVGVKIIGATEESFGNAVGITGNFKTGKTLARDGSTEIHDFNDLGLEWQVLPSDGRLFHEVAKPQFPELCYLPEDPRGDHARRLAESNITEEAAEAACAGLKDEFDRKGCVYDILATQDMDMVGAY